MASPNIQPQPNYKYTPSSAASTRQILESPTSSTVNPSSFSSSNTTSPTTSQNQSQQIPSRPANHTRRSSNYADAAAAASKKVSSGETVDESRISAAGSEKDAAAGSGAWKPTFVRKQSWNRQDMKRELQMSVVGEGKAEPGYSEGKTGL